MPTHLVAISSPLQLINALEAMLFNDLDSNDCQLIVRSLPGTQNDRFIRQQIDKHHWSSIYWYDSKSKIRSLPKLLRQFKGSRWSTVIGGELTAWWMNTLYQNIAFDRFILVDDGTMTLADYDNHLSQGTLPKKTKGLKDWILRLQGFKTMKFQIEPTLELFTIFDLEDTPWCKVQKNEMKGLQQQLSERHAIDVDGDLVFVGQPLASMGMITWKTQQKYLIAVQQRSPSGRVLYCPHRSEPEQILDQIAALKGFNITRFDCPIELGLIQLELPIAQLTGFCSTALFTLSRFYPNLPVSYIEFEAGEYLTEEYRVRGKSVYQTLSQSLSKFAFVNAIEPPQ